jgi:hypothetical protein
MQSLAGALSSSSIFFFVRGAPDRKQRKSLRVWFPLQTLHRQSVLHGIEGPRRAFCATETCEDQNHHIRSSQLTSDQLIPSSGGRSESIFAHLQCLLLCHFGTSASECGLRFSLVLFQVLAGRGLYNTSGFSQSRRDKTPTYFQK